MRTEILEKIILLVKQIEADEVIVLCSLLEEKSKTYWNKQPVLSRQKTSCQKRHKYSVGKIKKAVELKKQGKTRKEIEKLTGVKAGSLSNTKWLKARIKKGK